MIGNINIFNSGEFANFKSNVKQYSMKKLYSVYFLSLFILFFCSCVTKTKADPVSNSNNNELPQGTQKPAKNSTESPPPDNEIPDQSQNQPIEENKNTAPNDIIKLLVDKNSEKINRLIAELEYLKDNYVELESKSQFWTDPLYLYNKKIILDNGTNLFGNIIYQDERVVHVETLIGTLSLARESIIRVVDFQVETIEEELEAVDIIKNQSSQKIVENSISSAEIILLGDFSENQDSKNNTILSGKVQNTGSKQADFIKINFTIYKDRSSTSVPKEYTVFIEGSVQEFDNNIISNSSLKPNETGTFKLIIPSDFGPFISYAYSIDWEQYD